MELNEEIYDYIDSHIDPEPARLHTLMRRSNLQMVNGRMCSGHLQGRLLKMLVRLTGALKVLELGTFTGYSALCMAEGVAENLKDGAPQSETNPDSGEATDATVDTIEIFDENEDFLREAFRSEPHGQLVRLIIGDALEVMPELGKELGAGYYDFIFIDADKRVYPEYYRLAKVLLRRGGLIMADNTLWDGHPVDPARHDRQTEGVRRFNDEVAADPEVEKVILPLRDGLTLIRKR